MVGLLESHGVLVIRLPLASADVDAFSLPFRDRPIVVLGADKNDRARSRFDAAHELGHLVMHGEDLWGLPDVERQAHRFAAAFLMPKQDIASELPQYPDWPRFFALKRQWQVSLAALLMRARVLGRISEGDYVTAIKAASARGWRRIEPVPLGRPEQPNLLQALLTSATVRDCRDLLPKQVVHGLQTAVAA
jgi:Zn-dependent peptidase ImmA (M78 family)